MARDTMTNCTLPLIGNLGPDRMGFDFSPRMAVRGNLKQTKWTRLAGARLARDGRGGRGGQRGSLPVGAQPRSEFTGPRSGGFVNSGSSDSRLLPCGSLAVEYLLGRRVAGPGTATRCRRDNSGARHALWWARDDFRSESKHGAGCNLISC